MLRKEERKKGKGRKETREGRKKEERKNIKEGTSE